MTRALLLLAWAAAALAHNAPIAPSQCALGALELRAGEQTSVAAPGASEASVRINWDAGADEATVCVPPDCRTPLPARPLTGALSGTLTLPPVFVLGLLDTGDLVDVTIPLALVTPAGPATLVARLTTGLAAADGRLLAGRSIDPNGHFVLVGTATGAGTTMAVTLDGTAQPAPDLDQFAPAVGTLAGSITPRRLTLRARLVRDDLTAAAGARLLARVTAGDRELATLDLPSGLAPQGRHAFRATAADGTRVELRLVRARPQPTWQLLMRSDRPAVAGLTGTSRVELTFAVGDVLGRARGELRGRRVVK